MSGNMQRVLRRESHSGRSGMSVTAAVVVALVAVYALLELVLAGIGQPPWLSDPGDSARWLAELPGTISPALLGAAGVLLALLGLICLGHGVLPGRRARHVIADPRVAIVVDDEVMASALAKCARVAAGVTREQVMVVVSARNVQVFIRPTSGIPLSESNIKAAVETELATMALDPVPAVSIKLAESGVIGV